MLVVTAAQMRALDQWTIAHGTPGPTLMERAGKGATAVLRRRWKRGRTVIVCGRGNNGGDGFVIARHLKRAGVPVDVWLAGAPDAVRGDAAQALKAWRKVGGRVRSCGPGDDLGDLRTQLAKASLVVDALLGTGLNAPVEGAHAALIDLMNAAAAPILAVDIASGLSSDTGRPLGAAVRATVTATFGHPKVGQVLHPGIEHTGELEVVDIGLAADGLATVGPTAHVLDPRTVGALIPRRPRDAHKGTFGHLLIVAGSRGKTGAAHLAAMGALRSGAGLVTVATPSECLPIVASMAPEYMTEPIDETPDGLDADAIDDLLEAARDVLAIGPGLGQAPGTRTFIQALVDRATLPLVIDADGLNAFAGQPDRLAGREGRDVIITPHPGEMARLVGMSIEDVQANRLEIARAFASTHHVYVVLKGHRTLIATPDGTIFINPTGNPGMATGGTGDVLTGMIAAWLAQLLDAEAACKLAVYLHGMAGDLAEADEGEASMTSGDLAAHIGDAILELTARRKVVEKT
jgi:NAD(P)H-hydrate epimerase